MHQFSHREISEEHANKLNRAMLRGEGADIPEHVRDMYWRMKCACDRLNCAPTDQLLVMVILAADGLPELPSPTFADLVASGEVNRDTPILVKYRNRDVEAQFVSLSGADKALVILEGEERAVKLENCSALETAGA